ncbi:putative inorganic phosphate cotransporter [Halotydeus destructor]|nr:putative inorganic phosphate cotransporter [Halotydeus destructor]
MMDRNNINVTIVAMTATTDSSLSNGTEFTAQAPRYDWSPREQGLVLGAFFYSYVTAQIPAGRVVHIFGAKGVMLLGLIGSGFVNLATPFIASNISLMVTSRVTLGVFQAGVPTAAYCLVTDWFPDDQRSLAYSFILSSYGIGSSVTAILSGYLSDQSVAGGWPSVFYISAAISFSFAIVLTLSLTNEPDGRSRLASSRKNITVPWARILSSRPLIAITYLNFVINVVFVIFTNLLPSYFHQVFHLSSTEVGVISSMVNLTGIPSILVSGLIWRIILSKNMTSRTNIRKIIELSASVICILSLAGITVCGDKATTIILFMAMNIAFGSHVGGNGPIISEMTHNFTAIVYALYAAITMTSGFLTPMLAGYLLQNRERDVSHQWNILFFVVVILMLIGAVFAVLSIKAERQIWDHV